MKIRRNSFLFVLTLSLILFISPLVGVLWSSPAQAVCVRNPFTGRRVCHQDLDPTRLIPGSAEAVEQLWGEAGSAAYQAAANWMRANNGSSQSLDSLQKQYLRPHFGDLVDRVAVVYNANLMDELSAMGYRIPMSQSAAQTYCNRIYVDDPYQQGDVAQIILLAHELTHSRQCENYGGAGTFGFHYFREYKRAGENYANNRLEREAFDFEAQFARNLNNQPVSSTLVSGYFKRSDRPEVYFVNVGNRTACHVQNPSQMEVYGGFGQVQTVQGDGFRSGTQFTGSCLWPDGLYRSSERPEVYYLHNNWGSACWVRTSERVEQLGGWDRVRLINNTSRESLTVGRTYSERC